MTSVGISEAEKAEILRLCAAILYLGNITFTEDDKEQAQIHDKDSALPWAERRDSLRSSVVFWLMSVAALDWFSHLMQCEPANVQAALCSRTITSGSKRASAYACPQNAAGVRCWERATDCVVCCVVPLCCYVRRLCRQRSVILGLRDETKTCKG